MAKSLRDRLTNVKIWRSSGAEFIGTLFLVLLMISSQARDSLESDSGTPSVVLSSFVYALSVMSLSWGIQHVSGGHINPAITVAFFVTRKISVIRAIFYISAQTAASILAASIIYAATGKDTLNVFQPHESLNVWQAAGIELLVTFLYAFVFFACTDRSRPKEGNSINLGAAVFIATLFSKPLTGAALNPTLLLGPAVLLNKWKQHWIYWAGSLIGATLAGLLYDTVFASNASVRRTVTCFTSCSYVSDAKYSRDNYKIIKEQKRLTTPDKPRRKTEQV